MEEYGWEREVELKRFLELLGGYRMKGFFPGISADKMDK
jgi:hypothetical protein